MKKAKLKDGYIIFTYDEFIVPIKITTALNMVKGEKLLDWPNHQMPLTQENVELLITHNFEVSDELMEFLLQTKKESKKVVETKIEGLKGELFDYQKEGVAFLERKNGRVLLADQQGLGKTLQALAYLQRNPSIRPAVVVCPASLKLNWKAEAEKWTTIKAEVVKGLKPYQTKAELIIINYDIVHTWIETLHKTEFKCLILDESVAIKESTARRTKAVKRLAKGIQHVIALSGTPILNKPSEIYNTLAVVSPGLFDSPSKFKWRYCNMKYNGFGWDYSGASHIPELHTILTSTVMLRRLKEDVLKDLPDKLFSFVPIEIDNEEEYIKAESDFIAYIREKKGDEKALRAERAQQFAKIEVLKQLSVKGKIKASMDWIDNLLSVDGKLVVFCSHHFVVDELMTKFKSIAVKLDGRDTAIEKNRSVERFQNEERIRLFVGNIKAAGSGLTLTASSNVAFMEYPWSPADLQQCADRCHRIGQKDTVNVYYLHGNNTIEERLIKILDRKKLVLDAMLDGIDTQQENLLTEIIKSYI